MFIETEDPTPGVPDPEDIYAPDFEGIPGFTVGVSTMPGAGLSGPRLPVSQSPGQVWVEGRGWRTWSQICRGALVVRKSRNMKIGDASTTYASQESCPRNCPFIAGNGCYAETDKVFIQTRSINESGKCELAVARDEAEGILSLVQYVNESPRMFLRPIRLHTVGDCRSREAARMVAAATMEWLASPKLTVDVKRGIGAVPAWSYTHSWVTRREDWLGVSVLKSCHSMKELDLAHRQGWGCAVVVDNYPNGEKSFRMGGYKIIPCPNIALRPETLARRSTPLTCVNCQFCWADRWLHDNKFVIAFKAHGPAAMQAQKSTFGKVEAI